MLDKTFDFLESEGSTDADCCSDPSTTKCPGGTSAGQLWIQDTCDNGEWEACTYWNAPKEPLAVGSDKSIVGVGDAGIMRGKGIRLSEGASNVIIQNIHFTVHLPSLCVTELSGGLTCARNSTPSTSGAATPSRWMVVTTSGSTITSSLSSGGVSVWEIWVSEL
ncbi:hypothetical protein IMZ48_12975 [Candidatus Bathyarchaeota archaeon]|nr:hypothetical protein [Candidatus Bathyarchaeota archaeon]